MRWLLLLCSVAWAHGGLPAGNTAFFDDGELVGGSMALGLLTIEDGESTWVAKGAVNEVVNGFYRRDDGSTLALSFDGLFVTQDGGCTWTRGALEGRQVRLVAQVDGPHLVATLADAGLPGKLVESFDDGATWTDTALVQADFFPRQIELTEDAWFVTGFGDDPIRQVTWRSRDSGQSWDEPPAFAGVDTLLVGRGEGTIYVSQPADVGSTLWVSDDGFDTMTAAGSVPLGRILNAVEKDGVVFALADGLVPYRSEGGELIEQEPGPTDCLGPVRNGTLWTCADVISADGPFLRSTDLQTFETPLSFATICPRQCPEGTAGHDANALDWVDAQDLGLGAACDEVPEPTPTPPPEEPADCSCEGGSMAVFLPLLIGLRRRYSAT
jgi:hypothetical protein